MSRIVRSAVPFVAGLAVFLNTAHAEEATTAKSKPTVYNYISRENDPHDKAAESAYAKKFTIVDVRDRKQLTRAVLKEYVHPRPVLSESGQELKGRVAVMMIMTSDGRVVEPFILESTDRRLNTAALDAVRQWRFAPARLNGSPVSRIDWTVFGKGKEVGFNAVDAKGLRHRGSEWMNDLVVTSRPEYPRSERAQHHTGSGLLRLTLDLKTGSVTRVAIVRSTGFPALDNSAIAAFREWRWKPGRWKEIDVPITFGFGLRGGMTIGPRPP
jgi:TonB family protein